MNLNRTFTYYCADDVKVTRGVRVKVPLNGRETVGFADSIEHVECPLEEYEKTLGFEIKEITEVLDEEPLLNDELYELGLWMSHQTVSPVISCFQAMLPNKIKPRSNRSSVAKEYLVHFVKEVETRSDRQKAAMAKLRKADMERSEFNKEFPGVLAALLKKEAVTVTEREREASFQPLDIKEADYPLTFQQKEAIGRINESEKNVILLHGLTGSGKTEIYMQLAKEKCLSGKQVLILVPEISLTPQMVERMTSRFGHNIAIYHSRLNDQERYEQYQLVRNHQVSIVVGTRSAVFMPFDNLGLIVLDEEHDHSYKQASVPRYHCRDVAIKRAKNHGCKVILGSATPALESYSRAYKGVYELVELKNRIYQNLPQSHLVDMQKEIRKGNPVLSEPLRKAIRERLDNKEQCILLLNRRGYTTVMRCRNCGHVVQCPHCDIAMSYHKDEDMLVCHTCGTQMSADMDCPECGAHSWYHFGLGTQRLYETIQNEFPDARIMRMDADTTHKKGGHQEILDAFGRKEADILLGTQMIAKGLDFADVTLVGIFNADALLGRTDYRSVEVTFDLLVQASGRSGRGQKAGEVFVQAYDTSHYCMRLAVRQDYMAFFAKEMEYRHIAEYPPYRYLAAISFSGPDSKVVGDAAYETAAHFREKENIRTLGPSELPKSFDEYRRRVVLKGVDRERMIDLIWQWYDSKVYNRSQVRVQIDIDPYVLD